MLAFRSHATMWSCPLDNGPFGEYEKAYNSAVLRERTQWRGKGRLPFWRVCRAVRSACDAAFAVEVVKQSFTKTLFSPLLVEHLTESQLHMAASDMPGEEPEWTDQVMISTAAESDPVAMHPHHAVTLPSSRTAFHFDTEAMVQRMTDLVGSNFALSNHSGAGRDVSRARKQEQKDQVQKQNLQYSDEIIEDMNAKGVYTVPRGIEPVLITDEDDEHCGKYKCYKCRVDSASAKRKANLYQWSGGPNNTGGAIQEHELAEGVKAQAAVETKEKREEREALAAARKKEAEEKRLAVLVRVGDLEKVMSSMSSSAAAAAEETVETVSEQIVELETAVKGMNVQQHDKVKEARDLIVQLKGKKKSLAEAEKKKKKGRADHLKRIQQEAKEDDSEERKEERREAIAERKRKRGDADKHWAMEILKVSGQKKAKLTALEQMVASMRREMEEEVKLELE